MPGTKRSLDHLLNTSGFGISGKVPTFQDWQDLLASYLPLVDNALTALTENTDPQADDLMYFIRVSDGAVMKIKYSTVGGGGGGGGEANDGANVGSSGVGVYDSKSGTDIQLRKLNAASSKITITLNGQQIDFDINIDANDVNLENLSNVAQLTRAAGDFSASITELTALADNDRYIVESSANSNAKRYLLHSTLKSVFAPKSPNNEAKTANYTFVEADNNKIITAINTINLTATTGLTTGWQCTVINDDSNTKSFVADTGVTIHSKESNLDLANQYGAATLYHKGSNVFYLIGDLS